MQKQEQTGGKVGYVVMALLLITYIFFPSWYRAISQKMFGVVYMRHAQSLQDGDVNFSMPSVSRESGMLPVFVIARPPQTPYDYVITTVPEQLQEDSRQEGRWYVYDEASQPVGYVKQWYPSLLVIPLFSAPGSDELFSVAGYVSRGIGDGGGSFSLQVPMDIAVTIGMPIVHQATGKILSAVVAIENIPEKNVQKVVGVLRESPLEIAVLYMADEPNNAAVPEVVESVTDAARALADTARKEQEEGQEAAPEQQPETVVPETPSE